jgi:glutamine transport system permease protein
VLQRDFPASESSAHRITRAISIAVLMVLVCLVSPSQATDYRSSWFVVESGTSEDLLTVEEYGGQIWIFGTGGVMLNSADNGETWSNIESPTQSDIHHSDSGFGSILVAGESGIALLKSEEDSDWQNISLTGVSRINGVALTGSQSAIAVGDDGGIYRYQGGAWESVSLALDLDMKGVSFYDESSGVIVGSEGIILFSDDGGETWDYREAPEGVGESSIVGVEFYSPVRIYAITEDGRILMSASNVVTGTDVGYVWTLVEFERHYPPGSNQYQQNPSNLGVELSSIEVVTTTKLMMTGESGYLSISTNGGTIVSQQINPLGNDSVFNHIHMLTGFVGIAVGDNGAILWTEDAGVDDQVGFEVINFNDFDNFVDYSKDMLFAGFIATIKIVVFGIIMGFLIGVSLAMCKTSPTSMKYMVERFDPKIVRLIGIIIAGLGLYQFYVAVPKISELGLDGIENIFIPVGEPGAFGRVLLGIGLTFVGVLFMTNDGKFSKLELKGFKLNPWGVRPLNTIATVYTDFFRNTPLIVQFMFIHFGLQLGRLIQEPAQAFLEESTGGVAQFIKDEFLNDRAYISAICALGFNSGAYQCETIRGAIQAIPSAQMEAGRSIGLTYMQTMRRIILPQAIRICIPPMGNEMVNLVLNSSLAMVIGYAELTRQGKLITAVTFQMAYTWGMVLVSYFVITWTLALLLRRLEESTRIPGLGMTGGD